MENYYKFLKIIELSLIKFLNLIEKLVNAFKKT